MSLTLTHSVHIRVCHQLSFPCNCFCTTKHVLVISYAAAKCVSARRCSLLDRLGDWGWIRRTLCFVTQSEKVKGPPSDNSSEVVVVRGVGATQVSTGQSVCCPQPDQVNETDVRPKSDSNLC